MLPFGFLVISILIGAVVISMAENRMGQNRFREQQEIMRHRQQNMTGFSQMPMMGGGMYPPSPMLMDPFLHERIEHHYRDRSNFLIFVVIVVALFFIALVLRSNGML